MPETVVSAIVVVLVGAFVGGAIASRLKQPLILGYLLAGLLVGVASKWLHIDTAGVRDISEAGVVFLMFMIGIGFSEGQLGKIRMLVPGSLWQILVVGLGGTLLLQLVFGMAFPQAVVASFCFSLSSTAIVMKVLEERRQTESIGGEIMFGWLLVQDLATLPLITLITILFKQEGNIAINLLWLAAVIGILSGVLFLSRKSAARLTDWVAGLQNRELLLIFTVALVLISGMLVQKMGFSLALGAFLVGVLLSRATAHYAIFSEIRPLKDLFLAVFFVSLGLSLQPGYLVNHWPLVLAVTVLFMCLKMAAVAVYLSSSQFHAKTIINSAFGLAQVGEFSFVLAATSVSKGIIDSSSYSLIVAVALLSMLLTPAAFNLSEIFYRRSRTYCRRYHGLYCRYFASFDQLKPHEDEPLRDHAIILGYGRVGKWVGEALEENNIPYLIVEHSPDLVKRLKREGKAVVFGDPTELSVMEFAGAARAKVAVLALPDSVTQKVVVANCQTLNPKIIIICRSHHDEDKRELDIMGVNHVIQPEFEAALSIAHRSLHQFGISDEQIKTSLKDIKRKHHAKTV